MSQIEQIELSMEQAKDMVSLRDAALKLATNRDFKKVVQTGYFQDEAIRLTELSADPLMEDHRADIFLSIQGISVFKQYLRRLVQMGDIAETEIADAQTELEYLRNEEGAE